MRATALLLMTTLSILAKLSIHEGITTGYPLLVPRRALVRGVTIKELADYLGHSDPGFTLRTYTHLLPSSHEKA